MVMEKMRTAEEMLAYIKEKDTGCGLGKSKCLEYLRLIEADLENDEYAVLVFAATYTTCYLKNEGDFVSVLTNKRILMAKQGQETVFKRIPLAEFIGLTVNWGKTFASLIIDTSKMQLFMENTVPRIKVIQELFEEELGTLDGVGADIGCKSAKFLLPEAAPKLRTAEEMLNNCEENDNIFGMKRDKALECFRIIEECLTDEEYVSFSFIAQQYTLQEKEFAVAVSNRRILMGRQELLCGRIFRFAAFDELERVSVLPGSDTARIKVLSRKIEIDMEAPVTAGRFITEVFAQILVQPEPEEKTRTEMEGSKYNEGNISGEPKDQSIGKVKMKTAEEMLQYCQINYTMGRQNPKHRLTDFEMAADCMEEDEFAISCFVGAGSETSLKAIDGGWNSVWESQETWACVFTNRRIVMAQGYKRPFRLKTIPYKRLNDIFVAISQCSVDVIISTSNCDLDIHPYSGGKFIKQQMEGIQNKVIDAKRRLSMQCSNRYSPADEIRKFKALLDDEIITQEEFQRKKAELLATRSLFIEGEDFASEVVIEI